MTFGGDDYVTMDGVVDDFTGNDVTTAAWIKTTSTGGSDWFSMNPVSGDQYLLCLLNGTAVVYNNDMSLTQKTGWTEWVIPLQQFAGANLTNVTSVTIGFGTRGNTAVVGGAGQMYIDDIRLYRPSTVP